MRAAPWVGGLLTAAVVFAGLALGQAFILRGAVVSDDEECDPDLITEDSETCGGLTVDVFHIVDEILSPALWIIVALAPLTIAWGGGMMLFGGKHGPQLMGGAIVAVVLVASAAGIAA